MCQDEVYSADNLIELTPNLPAIPKNDLDDNNSKGAVLRQDLRKKIHSTGGGSGGGFTAPAPAPFQYPAAAVPPAPGASAYPPAPPQDAPQPPPFQYYVPAQAPESPNSNVERKSKLNMLDDDEEGGGPPPYFPPDHLHQDGAQQQPQAPAASAPPPLAPPAESTPGFLDLPDLPAVPVDTPLGSKGGSPDENKDDDIDFDDLTKRFEALKKKK